MGKIYYGKHGNECDEESSFAYKWEKENKTLYYVREYCGVLLEKDTRITRENLARYKWRKVSISCFKYYMNYLESNNQSYYNLAFRQIDA